MQPDNNSSVIARLRSAEGSKIEGTHGEQLAFNKI